MKQVQQLLNNDFFIISPYLSRQHFLLFLLVVLFFVVNFSTIHCSYSILKVYTKSKLRFSWKILFNAHPPAFQLILPSREKVGGAHREPAGIL